VDRRYARQRQHVSLATAAALVCFSATGVMPDASKPEEMRELLNEVAHALSNLASIYAADAASGQPVEVPKAEVLGAVFLRGAHLLVTTHGKEYRGLTVERGEMNAAIGILRRAGFALRGHGSKAPSN
jgi:hypothetical protein